MRVAWCVVDMNIEVAQGAVTEIVDQVGIKVPELNDVNVVVSKAN